MAKKISYNTKTSEALVLDLAKFRDERAKAYLEKRKSGKSKNYRDARKNIARVLTAMNVQKGTSQAAAASAGASVGQTEENQ